jgi:hypothetical protein
MTNKQTPMQTQSLTRWDLAELYPVLHAKIEEILQRDGENNHLSFWINYSGKYHYPSGKLRKFQLATAIEFLRRNGYTVEFSIKESIN